MSEKIKKLMYLERKSSVDIYNHLIEKEKEECDNKPKFEEKFKISDLIKKNPSESPNNSFMNTQGNSFLKQNNLLRERESNNIQHNPTFNQSVVIHESITNHELDLDNYQEDICTFNPNYRLEKKDINHNSNLVSIDVENEARIDDLNMSLQHLKEETKFEEKCENKLQSFKKNPFTEKKKLSIIDYPKIPINLSQSTFDLSLLNFPQSDKKEKKFKSQYQPQTGYLLIQPKLEFLINIIKNLKEEMIENILSLDNFIENMSLDLNQINQSTDTTELINNCMNTIEIFKKNINKVTIKYEKELKYIFSENYNRIDSLIDFGVGSLNNKIKDDQNKIFNEFKLKNSETNQYNLNISYLNKEILENSNDININVNATKEYIEKLNLKYNEKLQEKESEMIKLKEKNKIQENFINSSKGLIDELYKKNRLFKEKLIKYKIRCEGLK